MYAFHFKFQSRTVCTHKVVRSVRISFQITKSYGVYAFYKFKVVRCVRIFQVKSYLRVRILFQVKSYLRVRISFQVKVVPACTHFRRSYLKYLVRKLSRHPSDALKVVPEYATVSRHPSDAV